MRHWSILRCEDRVRTHHTETSGKPPTKARQQPVGAGRHSQTVVSESREKTESPCRPPPKSEEYLPCHPHFQACQLQTPTLSRLFALRGLNKRVVFSIIGEARGGLKMCASPLRARTQAFTVFAMPETLSVKCRAVKRSGDGKDWMSAKRRRWARP
eukprot:1747757-Pleurochrysis_carterae.AAC.2